MTDTQQASDEEIAALKEGLEGATPGPWYEGDRWVFVPPEDAKRYPSHALRNIFCDVDEAQANAAHIARCSPDAIRRLLARLEQAEARVTRLKHAVEFTARMAWRTDPPNSNRKMTDEERLSAIAYHPTIKDYGAPHRELAEKEAAALKEPKP